MSANPALDYRSPPPPALYAAHNWTGFYIGGNLGAAFDPNDLSIKDLSEEQDLTLSKELRCQVPFEVELKVLMDAGL